MIFSRFLSGLYYFANFSFKSVEMNVHFTNDYKLCNNKIIICIIQFTYIYLLYVHSDYLYDKIGLLFCNIMVPILPLFFYFDPFACFSMQYVYQQQYLFLYFSFLYFFSFFFSLLLSSFLSSLKTIQHIFLLLYIDIISRCRKSNNF